MADNNKTERNCRLCCLTYGVPIPDQFDRWSLYYRTKTMAMMDFDYWTDLMESSGCKPPLPEPEIHPDETLPKSRTTWREDEFRLESDIQDNYWKNFQGTRTETTGKPWENGNANRNWSKYANPRIDAPTGQSGQDPPCI